MILTKEERERLLAVKTTKNEARVMKKRFELLLEALKKPMEKPETIKINVGCPHCETAHEKKNPKNYNFNCKQCVYTKAALKELKNVFFSGHIDFACIEFFRFGEVHYEEICHLIALDRKELAIEVDPALMNQPDREALDTFAKGHIEWANLVLKQKTKRS